MLSLQSSFHTLGLPKFLVISCTDMYHHKRTLACTYIRTLLNTHIWGGIVIVIGNGYGHLSSNHGWGY